ncbi:hypothetical protein [Gloeobacter morelensis]|uniref:Uncharacterized protein n=1 Tax=Gloeobacter morelensis MG652769 TaxID=2781736 RepID=A0ABY3PT12_9CYAN|nr:hypothetical protein [Gloeobacter morelensis]UFP96777.1 hypothetical protein ISF26_11440 [Gloeobacter morelensis MG652769]
MNKRGKATHAWLLVKGEIVDLTADQFSKMNDSVVFTQKSNFYERFVDSKTITLGEKLACLVSDARREYSEVHGRFFGGTTSEQRP